jgi:superfamily I DNA/RNA helicase
MELTSYQKDIVTFFNGNPNSNMYINAKAGCGKSFIATQLLKDVDRNSIYLAFNKSIAEEMKGKITNPKVKICTIHSLCNSILLYNLSEKANNQTGGLGKNRNTSSKLDNLKIYKILNDIFMQDKDINKDFDYRSFLIENYVKLYNLVRLKVVDLEKGFEAKMKISDIVNEQGLFFHETYHKPTPDETLALIRQIDKKSLDMFEKEQIYDFTDMLYITLLKLKNKEWEVPGWNLYTNIVADESQDLSTIQLFLLKYIKRKGGRYIFILDYRQAIYAFSGANSSSYQLIKKLFAPIKEFDLPINYRCATSHLDLVNKLHKIGIKPCNTAPEGKIYRIGKNRCIELAQAGDYIVGRKNKWLLPVTLELIKRGKPVYIKDEGFVKEIEKLIEKTKSDSIVDLERKILLKEKRLSEKLTNEKDNQQKEEKNEVEIEAEAITFTQNSEDKGGQMEMFSAIKMLLASFKEKYTTHSKSQFLKYVQTMLNTTPSNNCIMITSIHCVKGLEANNVFVLNEGKAVIDGTMSAEQRQQEFNLSYVALTRAKENLYLVKPEGEEY